jgi:5'-AMP-activated protein kinase catalytic alpha subunit
MPEEIIELDPKTEAVFKKKGYKMQKKLSQGAFGQVYKGINTNTEELCAVKVMDLDKVGEKFKQKFLPRELAALIGVRHENVILIHDIIRANHKIYIFMEFASNGDIAGYLQKNGALNESLACYWFAQITDALKFIHEELHLAHRDIKIDNILLNDQKIAKLTDFGFAKEVWDEKKHKVMMSETFCGTEPYYSPQIVTRKPYNPFCADVWAMGVVLFCMLNNKFPFHFGDAKAMFKEQNDPNFIRTRYVKEFPKDLKNLQQRLFDPKEETRITLAQVLDHPWVRRKGK